MYKRLVLRTNVNFGFLGAYNSDRGVVPFERFSLGGSGLGGAGLQQIETVRMRGYPDNGSLSSQDGGIIFNRFSLELRHPISMKSHAAQIYGLAFVEAGNSFDEYKEWMHKADILPITSKQDFFGVSIVEGIYAETLPILPNRLSYPELFNDKLNPHIFYNNKSEFKDKLISAINNVRSLSNEMKKIREDVSRKFNWNTVSEEYDKTFELLLN